MATRISQKTGIAIVICVAFVGFIVIYTTICLKKTGANQSPNVVLIVVETLRADHVGFFGYKRDTTPNINRLAEGATTFMNAFAQAPCTTPSMWSIMTSKYAPQYPAPDSYITMAEYFLHREYVTAAFLSHHFLTPENSNLDQGFLHYDSKCSLDEHGLSARRAGSITGAMIEWLKTDPGIPYFAWLVYFDPHDPYIAPTGYKGTFNKNDDFSGDRRNDDIHHKQPGTVNLSPDHKKFLINAYDEEIRYMDSQVGRLIDHLKKTGDYENSLIVFTADHGEELGDIGGRWDHCQLLSRAESWVPLIIKMPRQKQGRKVVQAVQIIDIFPTLVDYLDASKPPLFYYNTLEGRSLMPLVLGKKEPANRIAVSFWEKEGSAVEENHKYWLLNEDERFIDLNTGEEFHDTALRTRLKNAFFVTYRKFLLQDTYFDATVERLKALGYIE